MNIINNIMNIDMMKVAPHPFQQGYLSIFPNLPAYRSLSNTHNHKSYSVISSDPPFIQDILDNTTIFLNRSNVYTNSFQRLYNPLKH